MRIQCRHLAVFLVATTAACYTPSLVEPDRRESQESQQTFVQTEQKEVDILFVIDNSGSMLDEQQNLINNFPRLIEALRVQDLGGSIPNVHIGVVTTDIGVGAAGAGLPGCDFEGDDGRLRRVVVRSEDAVTSFGQMCRGISVGDPWLEFNNGQTNIVGAPSIDAIEQVKEAFSCLANVGIDGCGFEQPLEAARRAVSPGANPGFIRPDALLAVVFITDEDDCSVGNAASGAQFFSSNDLNAAAPGEQKPTSFRCFFHGVRCDGTIAANQTLQNCAPTENSPYLTDVAAYRRDIAELKPGRVIAFGIAGPVRSSVGIQSHLINGQQQGYDVAASCAGVASPAGGGAAPAIRLESFISGFGAKGHFNVADPSGSGSVDICSSNFGPALTRLGNEIVAALGPQCLTAPPLLDSFNRVCSTNVNGSGVDCSVNCMNQAKCIVEDRVPVGDGTAVTQVVPKCPVEFFGTPGQPNCAGVCPCWRMAVPRASDGSFACSPQDGSPFSIEVLRDVEPVQGTSSTIRCLTSPLEWGSSEFNALPAC